ncbi:MAG TPA: alpha/beta hydrolase [Acidimicrobiales bacterium]|nr:alpha/beta hydrolase [Acidimicrobiales bacterium]
MSRKTNVIVGAAGVAVTGLAVAGVAAKRILIERARRRGDPEAGADFARTAALEPQWIEMDDGACLKVVQRGSGRPIVLVHGMALSSVSWTYQLEDLAGEGRVIAYDQRGHNDSTLGADGLNLTRLASDLYELFERLDLRAAVLVGHSLGGMVVLRMLADHPELAGDDGRVAALGLVATSASPGLGSGVPGAKAILRAVKPLTTRGGWVTGRLSGQTLPTSDVSFLLARAVFGAKPDGAHIDLTREISSRIPIQVTADLTLEILHLDQESTLCDIALPTAIVVGSRDLMTPVRHARALARSIPSASLVELPGCGHMVMLERRYELDDIIRGLLRGDAGGGAKVDAGGGAKVDAGRDSGVGGDRDVTDGP